MPRRCGQRSRSTDENSIWWGAMGRRCITRRRPRVRGTAGGLHVAAGRAGADRCGDVRSRGDEFSARGYGRGRTGCTACSAARLCAVRGSEIACVCLQNIGGIGNLTAIPAGGTASDLIAFDTGPGNMVIDALMERLFDKPYDRDGRVAARGRVLADGGIAYCWRNSTLRSGLRSRRGGSSSALLLLRILSGIARRRAVVRRMQLRRRRR